MTLQLRPLGQNDQHGEPAQSSAPFPADVPGKPSRTHFPWLWWHWAVVVVGGPLIAYLVAVGAWTNATWIQGGLSSHASPAPAASSLPTAGPAKPDAPKAAPAPTYDLAGYLAAIRGPEEHAFASALYAMRAAMGKQSFSRETADAPQLVAAATIWAGVLRNLNPPPSYQPALASYRLAATLGAQAGRVTLRGIGGQDLRKLARAAQLAARAQWALLHPGATPTPSASPTAPLGS